MCMQLHQLGKTYRGGVQALKGVTCSVSGGTIGLVGPNGAGKTTLMRILATITRPTDGYAHVDSTDVVRHPQGIRAMLGYLPQQFDFYPGFRVVEVLDYIGQLKRIPSAERPVRIDEVLELTGLADFEGRRVSTLSGGMKRRLGIAQALLNRPRLLIVDEPTAGLDPEERVRFRSLLSQLSRDRLVILSTHIVFDVEVVASTLMVLNKGSVLFVGPPAEAVEHADGRVWQVRGCKDPSDAMDGGVKATIVNAKAETDGLMVRLVTPERPCSRAEAVAPTLEDAYLYLTGGFAS